MLSSTYNIAINGAMCRLKISLKIFRANPLLEKNNLTNPCVQCSVTINCIILHVHVTMDWLYYNYLPAINSTIIAADFYNNGSINNCDIFETSKLEFSAETTRKYQMLFYKSLKTTPFEHVPFRKRYQWTRFTTLYNWVCTERCDYKIPVWKFSLHY